MSTNSKIDHKKALEAIPKKEIKKLSMPAHAYAQEAKNIYHLSTGDKKLLIGAGMDWTMVESITERIDVFEMAQSKWMSAWNTAKDARREWNLKSPAGYELRDKLLNAFRYAFRDSPNLMAKTARIAGGNSHSDMLMDLNDMAVIGLENKALLEAIKFDLGLLDKARAMNDELGDLLAVANGDKQKDTEARIMRDRAFTYLKTAIDAVRDCARYIFWKDQEKLKGYASQYNRSKRNKGNGGDIDTDNGIQSAA